jgi:AmiR/NasT family two-component response regulator
MASRDVDQDEALRLLRQASSRSNTPLRTLAAVIVKDRRALV